MITARLDHAQIDALLRRIESRGGDLSAPLSACGEIMLTSISRNFQTEGRYSTAGDMRGGSTRWAPLADATKLQRIGGKKAFTKSGAMKTSARKKLAGMKILQVSGKLAKSFSKQVSGNTLVVGTNRIDAAKHHYGGFGGRGKRVWEPARPILVVQDADVEDMVDVLQKHVLD